MKKKRILKTITAVILMMAFAVGCNKPDNPNNSGNNGNTDSDIRVTTYSPQNITATTAKCGGDVIVTQGLSLTELGVCWSKEHNPTADQSHLSTTVWNEPFVCTITNLEPETQYYVRAYILRGLEYYYGEEKSFSTTEDYGIGMYNGHEYVDLGLPSGTLWAVCNIGANTPESYGDYFAWGETSPKTSYVWNTYKYCNDGDPYQLTKYCGSSYYGYNGFVDNLIELQPEDDAATANWGDGWRMPTHIEWGEMRTYCTQTWIVRNGVNGCLFTADNGYSLFLPAAGVFTGDEPYGLGEGCRLWSSSRNNHMCDALDFHFNSEGSYVFYDYRYYGLTIRPVHSAK